MIQQLYSIYDKKANSFSTLILEINDGIAIRSITDFIKQNPNSAPAQHPEDFKLMRLGSWDQSEGELYNDGNDTILELKTVKQTLEK
jgi:hypothetical protein